MGRKADDIAIVGVGYSKLARDSGQSIGHLALTAARNAILDSGLDRSLIDGINCVYSTDLAAVWPAYVIDGLKLGDMKWVGTCTPPSSNTIIDAINAVRAGACDYALCYHAKYRWDTTSRDARNDPLRKSPPLTLDATFAKTLTEPCAAPQGLAAVMRRHMHEFGTRRDHFGMVAVNNRTKAQNNPRAVFHGQPLTMDDYLASPAIMDPFTMLDMDVPIDGAMAAIVTTAERAADLPNPPVYVEAATHMAMADSDMSFQPWDTPTAQRRLVERLWALSGANAADLDLINVYDGFSILAVTFLEAALCGAGEVGGMLDDAWDAEAGVLNLLGRIAMCPHGGNLSEGRVQGMGHVMEAIVQLRGQAGARQVAGARRAMVLNGTNPVLGGLILAA